MFAFLIVEIDAKSAMTLAESIRTEIAALQFLYAPNLTVTIRIGLAVGLAVRSDNTPDPALLVAADNALYAAKLKGGNVVEVAEGSSSST